MNRALRERMITNRQFDELLALHAAEVQRDPNDPEHRRQMAWVLAGLGRLSEAVAEQERACQLRPDDPRFVETLKAYQANLAAQKTDHRAADVSDVFQGIHQANAWGGGESLSGPGSGFAVTAPVRLVIPVLMRGLEVKTMLDAPCGDFSWMSTVSLAVERYTGVDVVPTLIDEARARASEHQEFVLADITRDPLPEADLVFCRDCLVHLTELQAFAVIENFKRSGSQFLLTTTFYATHQNGPGSTGGWRPINLQRPPFSFPQPMILVPERRFDPERKHSDKSLGLWKLADLPDSPAG